MLFTIPTLFLTSLFMPPIRAYTPLSDSSLSKVSFPSAEEFSAQSGVGGLLSPLLIPRVPNTPGSAKALQHLHDTLAAIPGWRLEISNSTSTTPLHSSPIPFRNLIATLDPPDSDPAEVTRLTLVAHYDSKIEPEGFIGATDSAAPCAMILHAAQAVSAALQAKWAEDRRKEVEEGWFNVEDPMGLQILFLDGEEAFQSWSDQDSLYGARALAEQWEQDRFAVSGSQRGRSRLDGIELFMLLDLLGASEPAIPSYFKTTHWAYKRLAELEKRLRDKGLMASGRRSSWFPDAHKESHEIYVGWGGVQDDHIPFLQRGVEVLHIIPSPFPKVWHTMDDDGAHLDTATTRDWAGLVAGFVLEWFDAGEFIDGSNVKGDPKVSRAEKTEL